MQRERRRDPYPWTWEIPMGLVVAGLLLVVLGIQLARGLANTLAGAGWTWPASDTGQFASPLGSAFWLSLPSVLAGDASAGLAQQSAAHGVASSPLLWTCLIAVEGLMFGVSTWVAVRGYRQWGPDRMMGMATAAEAETILGITRLRTTAAIVRPDLYGPQATAPAAAVHREDGEASNLPLGQGLSPWLQPGRRRERNNSNETTTDRSR